MHDAALPARHRLDAYAGESRPPQPCGKRAYAVEVEHAPPQVAVQRRVARTAAAPPGRSPPRHTARHTARAQRRVRDRVLVHGQRRAGAQQASTSAQRPVGVGEVAERDRRRGPRRTGRVRQRRPAPPPGAWTNVTVAGQLLRRARASIPAEASTATISAPGRHREQRRGRRARAAAEVEQPQAGAVTRWQAEPARPTCAGARGSPGFAPTSRSYDRAAPVMKPIGYLARPHARAARASAASRYLGRGAGAERDPRQTKIRRRSSGNGRRPADRPVPVPLLMAALPCS